MRKELVKMFKDKKFLKEIAIILLVGAIVNGACFLLCTLTGHCANLVSVLPYLPQNENTFFDETMVNTVLEEINNKYPSDDIYNQKYIISLGAEYSWYTYNDYVQIPTYRVYIIPNSDNVASTWSSGANFENFVFDNSNYWIELNVIPWTSYTVRPNNINGFHYSCSKSTSSGVTSLRLFGAYSPISISNNFYDIQVPGWNYPVYVNVPITTTDSQLTTGYVLSYNTDIIYPGDFTDLPSLNDILNNISNSFTPHSNNTPPSYDSNLSDGENISNSIDSLADNLNNAINNLGSNLKSWFDNLQKKLTDTTNAILGGMHDGFSTLNQNFKDFFGAKLDAILNKLDYFQEPFSAEDLAENLNNAHFSSDFLGLITTIGSFSTAFTSGSEPNSCSFTLDFSHSYYDFGVCEFSLDWILPFRSTIRLIVGCLCVYSLIVSIFTSLNTYIGGTSSINDDI